MSRRRYYKYNPSPNESNAFTVAVMDVLDEWNEEFQEKVYNAAGIAAKDTVERLKATSPRRPNGGEYARTWRRKKTKDGTGWVVYNKDNYRLTHLLEYGHAVHNQYGATNKRAAAHPHIKPAEQEGAKEFEELIRK